MRIKLWGVQGSIPAPLTSQEIKEKLYAFAKEIKDEKLDNWLFNQNEKTFNERFEDLIHDLPLSIKGTYGGDTSCIEVQCRNSPLGVFDIGSGGRLLGIDIMTHRMFPVQNRNINPLNTLERYKNDIGIFLSHSHWDHIQGFPFFEPAFLSNIDFTFYGRKHQGERLEDVLKGQQEFPNFPVMLEDMPSKLHYEEIGRFDGKSIDFGSAQITKSEVNHPGSAFAYRIEVDNCSFIYATDNEHRNVPDPALVSLSNHADILYYDTQYLPEEYPGLKGSVAGAMSKLGWGHSTYEFGIWTALEANVKTLLLGHHEPKRNDFQIEVMEKRANEYAKSLIKEKYPGKELEILAAYSGWTRDLYQKQ